MTIAELAEPEERWLPIPGFNGAYEASSLGRIRSMELRDSYGNSRIRPEPLVLRPSTSGR